MRNGGKKKLRQTINGADLRRMIISAAASIEIHKQALNELNVFPVPDGDTGTNMSMTINSAASACCGPPRSRAAWTPPTRQ